ncbi:MAG: hypothetical protein JRI25_25620, partial [Deltaproteobacteria bacterium]|nr:hypothetical protein [Deltaproteobacteria bacterium]
MSRALWGLALLTLLGCDGENGTDDTSDTSGGDGCPTGFHEAVSPGLLITYFRLNETTQAAAFDASGEYDGRPSACINDAGTAVDYIFLVGGDPYGRIVMEASLGGQSYDLNGTAGQISIVLTGADPDVSFDNGDWTTGTWYVTSVGNQFDTDLDGSAVADSQTL